MCPMYIWKCNNDKCEEETMVIAEPEQRDEQPEDTCQCGAKLVKRIMCACTFQRLYSGRKGEW